MTKLGQINNQTEVDKILVGLGNVDNTSDLNKPVSTLAQTALNNKVDKVSGKSLIDDTDITKLAGIEAGAEVNITENVTAGSNITIDRVGKDVTINSTATGGASTLDELTDVTITTPANGQALTYNGTIWVNTTPAGGGDMLKSENLSGLTDYPQARENLGLEIGVNVLAQRTFGDIVDSDIADFAPALTSDENYVTDAEKIVIGNTSGTNSGDNATNTQYSGLATSKQDTLVNQTNIKSVNGQSLLGAGDIEITGGGSGGAGGNVYLTALTSSIVGTYKQTSYTADVRETVVNTVVNNNEVLARTYLFDLPVGLTSIPAGTWSFEPTAYVSSNIRTTFIRIETFKRTAGGVETTLFSATSNSIENTTRQLLSFSSTQPAFTLNATDYLGSRVYVSTTHNANITVSYVVGDGQASYFTTPLPVRASQVRNTPAGNISSTDVQGAINELDTEKASLSGATFTGSITQEVSSILKQIATPTNPASGYNKMYFKSDGKLYKLDNAGVESEVGGGGAGLAWGATISGTTGTGLTTTIGDSASAGTIGQSIVIGNTQTNAVTGLNINTGTSARANVGISLDSTNNLGLASIRCYSAATQASISNKQNALVIGLNYNTNSALSQIGISIYNYNNIGTGRNTGIKIENKATTTTAINGLGMGLGIVQSGAGGLALGIYGDSNVNSSTNGLVNYTLDNTQSGATVMQKIDTGTSAQGHTGLLIKIANASTSSKGILLDPGTTGTGYGIGFNDGGADGFSGIKWVNAINATSTNAKYGIYMTTIGQNGKNGIGWYVANLENTTTSGAGVSKFFSLNNAVNTANAARNTDASEILCSRINTWTTGTVVDSYNVLYIKKTTVQNGAGGTYTSAGSVLKLENVATQTAGTLTDTVSVLTLAQGVATTGSLITMVSGNTSSRAIDFATNLTTSTAPTGASSYINVKINGVAHRILAQAV